MKQASLALLGALTLMLAGMPATADVVFNDDTIIQGSLCAGQDCVNDENFAGNLAKLKANNNRIGFIDTSAATAEVTTSTSTTTTTGQLGNAWFVQGNQRTNGGLNQFFIQQSSEDLNPILSNGSAIDYDCTMGTPGTPVGVLAEGVQAESEFCFGLTAFVEQQGIVLGRDDTGGVGLGNGTSAVDGQVALGNAELTRRLVHVAEGLAATDILVKGVMDQGVLGERKAELARLNDELDMIEQRIDDIALLLVLRERNDEGGLFTASLLLLPLLWARRRRRV